jgi:hypothetical protein
MTEIDRWKNRRAMSWLSLIAGILFPILIVISDSKFLVDISGAFYLFIGTVVGAYIGFATVDDKWQKVKND